MVSNWIFGVLLSFIECEQRVNQFSGQTNDSSLLSAIIALFDGSYRRGWLLRASDCYCDQRVVLSISLNGQTGAQKPPSFTSLFAFTTQWTIVIIVIRLLFSFRVNPIGVRIVKTLLWNTRKRYCLRKPVSREGISSLWFISTLNYNECNALTLQKCKSVLQTFKTKLNPGLSF